MVAVYRAPMRSRDDAVETQGAIDRARLLGLCGFGQLASGPAEHERLVHRVARFAAVDNGSFVWTRDTEGWYWLGRIAGHYFRDSEKAATEVDLVHVRRCKWLTTPVLEQDVPAAVVATFRRGGRNFQEIHHSSIGDATQRIWDARGSSAAPQ